MMAWGEEEAKKAACQNAQPCQEEPGTTGSRNQFLIHQTLGVRI